MNLVICVGWLVGYAAELEDIHDIRGLWSEPDCPESLEVVYAPSALVACSIVRDQSGPRKAIRYRDADHFAALADRPAVEYQAGRMRDLGWKWDDEDRCTCCGLAAYGQERYGVSESDDLCSDCREDDPCIVEV